MKPRRIVEIGCGNSTRIARQAIIDGNLESELIAIDSLPRTDISGLTNRFEQTRLEDIENFLELFPLAADDILFIDSSHEVFVGMMSLSFFAASFPSCPRELSFMCMTFFYPTSIH